VIKYGSKKFSNIEKKYCDKKGAANLRKRWKVFVRTTKRTFFYNILLSSNSSKRKWIVMKI